MPVEVTCPNCKSVLRAPDGMAGKKARCKKCQTSLRIPGAVPVADSVGDSQQLSVVSDNPFAFDGQAAASRVDDPTPMPPSRPAASDDPFALPPTASHPTPRPAERSKSKYRTKPADLEPEPTPRPGGRKPAKAGGGSGKLVAVILVVGVICGGGGAAAVYFLMQPKPGNTPAPTAAKPADPAPVEKPAETDKEKPPPAEKGKTSAAPKGAEKAKEDRGAAARKTPERKQAAVAVKNGLTFPTFPAGKGEAAEKAKATVSLDAEAAKVKRILVSGGDAGIVVVAWRSFEGFAGKGAKDTFVRVALASGKVIDATDVDADDLPWPRACDLSPDGNRLAVEGPVGKLTVVELGGKEKPLDGLEVVPADPKGKDAKAKLAAVYFAADDKVAVVSKQGAVDVWDVKEKKKAVEGTPLDGVAGPLADRRSVALTPDRKTVLAVAGGAVYEIPLSSCKPRTAFALPRKAGEGHALAADSAGTRVVVAYQATAPGPHNVLVVARLGESAPLAELGLDAAAGTPTGADWTGQDTAVVVTDKDAAAFVIDGESNRVVAGVKPIAPGVVQGGPATGVLWCVLPDPADAKKSLLVGVAMPHDAYFAMRDTGGGKPAGLVIGPDGLGK